MIQIKDGWPIRSFFVASIFADSILRAIAVWKHRYRLGRNMSRSALKKEQKKCLCCGLLFENRKKWRQRGVWEQVRYCSERCRRTAAKNRR